MRRCLVIDLYYQFFIFKVIQITNVIRWPKMARLWAATLRLMLVIWEFEYLIIFCSQKIFSLEDLWLTKSLRQWWCTRPRADAANMFLLFFTLFQTISTCPCSFKLFPRPEQDFTSESDPKKSATSWHTPIGIQVNFQLIKLVKTMMPGKLISNSSKH